MNWPIGCGRNFRGVFDRRTRHVIAFDGEGRGNSSKKVQEIEAELGDSALDDLIGEDNHSNLMDDIELLDGAGDGGRTQRQAFAGILRFGPNKLRCGAVFERIPRVGAHAARL